MSSLAERAHRAGTSTRMPGTVGEPPRFFVWALVGLVLGAATRIYAAPLGDASPCLDEITPIVPVAATRGTDSSPPLPSAPLIYAVLDRAPAGARTTEADGRSSVSAKAHSRFCVFDGTIYRPVQPIGA